MLKTGMIIAERYEIVSKIGTCLLYTSDAADD